MITNMPLVSSTAVNTATEYSNEIRSLKYGFFPLTTYDISLYFIKRKGGVMHRYLILLLLGLGFIMAAFAAERVVVCEEAYSEG
ncbi:hypothetical protein AMJ87_04775 [candidate division WOR_3 bacterium SM23_60]|uniref:Uncharacterized protein n=1 Tax=candidate division WOR_3 bacterium SM23_60 TaxID=1703780 RepID=A0A0S8GI32_UNCW3|nr:MAG: hypothetical protein AMJ87_04775 [candidate division WOR_3 bacterium SM23_60]